MSEQYRMSREEFLGLVSHHPSSECRALCGDLDRLAFQWSSTESTEERARIGRMIKAVLNRMQLLHCPDCPPGQ